MKFKKRQITMYVGVISICIISIILAIYIQFYGRVDLEKVFTDAQSGFLGKTTQQINELEVNFEKIFNNSVTNVSDMNNRKRMDEEYGIIYSGYIKNETVDTKYSIDVEIPLVNIENDEVRNFNIQTQDSFYQKAIDIQNNQNIQNTIYTVEYTANIYNDILSLVIISNLKEGSNPQRVIIQTFNYDLRNNKVISLEEVFDIENIEVETVQERINEKIEVEQNKTEDLLSLGYEIYSRNTNDPMYEISKETQFYINSNEIYIIYAYGNSLNTSEYDIVIL